MTQGHAQRERAGIGSRRQGPDSVHDAHAAVGAWCQAHASSTGERSKWVHNGHQITGGRETYLPNFTTTARRKTCDGFKEKG